MRIQRIQQIGQLASAAGGLQKQVESFISQVMFLAQGGLTFEELAQLLAVFVELCVHAAEEIADATGDEKKAAVLEAVDYLFTVLAPYVPLPWFLSPVRRFLREPVRQIVLAVASGLVELFVARLPEPPAPTIVIQHPAG